MIDLSGCISIPYFKKAVFTGSCQKMRYQLKKAEDAQGNPILEAKHWQGPYASSCVPEEAKTTAGFPFDQEGIRLAVEWLNEELKKYQ